MENLRRKLKRSESANRFLKDFGRFNYILTCDLETTSVRANEGCWITGSFGILDPVTLRLEDELDLKSKPYHWSEEARLVHKISEKTANQFPNRVETLHKLMNWLPKRSDFLFLCHARDWNFDQEINQKVYSHFDFGFLKMDFFLQGMYFDFCRHFNEQMVYSTISMARSLGFKDLKLNELCDYFNIELSNHHDARADRIAMEEVLRKLANYEEPIFSQRNGSSKLDS